MTVDSKGCMALTMALALLSCEAPNSLFMRRSSSRNASSSNRLLIFMTSFVTVTDSWFFFCAVHQRLRVDRDRPLGDQPGAVRPCLHAAAGAALLRKPPRKTQACSTKRKDGDDRA